MVTIVSFYECWEGFYTMWHPHQNWFDQYCLKWTQKWSWWCLYTFPSWMCRAIGWTTQFDFQSINIWTMLHRSFEEKVRSCQVRSGLRKTWTWPESPGQLFQVQIIFLIICWTAIVQQVDKITKNLHLSSLSLRSYINDKFLQIIGLVLYGNRRYMTNKWIKQNSLLPLNFKFA